MATTTPNLGLVKPDYEDLADIAVLNENSDTIDAAVKAVQDSVDATGSLVEVFPQAVTCAASGWTQLANLELGPGRWLVIVGGQFAQNGTGSRSLGHSTSDTTTPTGRIRAQAQAVANATTNISYSYFYTRATTTTVYLWGAQNSGGTLSCSPWISAVRIAKA